MVAALDYIASSPGLRVTELAIAMDVHQSTASNLVRQMVQRGLVRTERDPGDRRNVRLQLEDEGRQLLAALITESEAYGLWTLQASIFPENTTSISIHLGAGFREVGRTQAPDHIDVQMEITRGEWLDARADA